MRPAFLTADWQRLVMLNFAIDPGRLAPFVPPGTELDSWSDTTFVSLVAFQFLNTKLLGVPIPMHRDFEEINLRFYVRYQSHEGWRRGVVFVREVVPRWAIAAVARWIYHEKYVACPTRSSLVDPSSDTDGKAEYSWSHDGRWLTIGAGYSGTPTLPLANSQEEFITEHYWGYSSQRHGGTVQYQVEHPQWQVWQAKDITLEGDFQKFYGKAFADALASKPSSAFIANGSSVTVRRGKWLTTPSRNHASVIS